MESGILDLAFIEEQKYSKNVRAIPAFSEHFVVATHCEFPGKDTISIKDLSPEYEIYAYWNPEFEHWHSKYFDEKVSPLIVLNQDSLIPCFLKGNAWSIVPYSTGEHLKRQGLNIYRLSDGPSDRLIYYLVRGHEKEELIHIFLSLLDQELRHYPEIISFLQ